MVQRSNARKYVVTGIRNCPPIRCWNGSSRKRVHTRFTPFVGLTVWAGFLVRFIRFGSFGRCDRFLCEPVRGLDCRFGLRPSCNVKWDAATWGPVFCAAKRLSGLIRCQFLSFFFCSFFVFYFFLLLVFFCAPFFRFFVFNMFVLSFFFCLIFFNYY